MSEDMLFQGYDNVENNDNWFIEDDINDEDEDSDLTERESSEKEDFNEIKKYSKINNNSEKNISECKQNALGIY